MIVEYTGRQFVVTQKYKDRAQKGLKRVERVTGEAASAHIILSLDKYRKIAEVALVMEARAWWQSANRWR
jgi:putative sigma-54 modulation protein